MSQFVSQNVDGTYGNNDWLKNTIPFLPPNNIYTKGFFNETSTPVVCKDGTKKMQPSSPNAKYMDVCRDNGGVDNQKTNDNAIKLRTDAIAKSNEDALAQSQAQAQLQGSNTKEPIYYILVTAGVLIAGYFAYKKFKK
jgi:hypothetical protein